MPTINDYKKSSLKTLTGLSTGDINTLEYKWLRSVVTPYVGSIPDMWRKYLSNLGYTSGALNDRFMKYLGSLGYTGSLNNRWYQYWKNGGGTSLTQSLFRAGENGFLFGNFAELDELFLLNTGNTGNVAANDDPIGLALDDHSWGGLTLAQIIASAPELVTNGQFGTDTTGWTANGSTLAAVAGQLEITSTAGGFNARAVQSFTTVAGATYRLSVDSLTVGNAIRLGTTLAGVDIFPNTAINIASGYTVYFVALGTTTHLSLVGSTVLNAKNYFDNISVKLVPGNHAVQSTAANRPLWKANAGKPYLLFDGTNDSLVPPFTPMSSGTGLTFVAAFNSTQGAVQASPIGGGSSVGPSRAYICLLSNGTLSIGWGTQVNRGGAVIDLRNQNHIVIVTGESSNRDIWLDGVNITADFAAASGTPGGAGNMTIGGRQSEGGGIDLFFPGRISSALCLNRRATPAEIQQITSEFRKTF